MSAKTKTAAKPKATAAKTAKPARKGTVRTTAGTAAPVRTRKLSAAEKKTGTAKLSKPTARRAAPKPTAKPKTTRTTGDAARAKEIAAVRKARGTGATKNPWPEVAEKTGFSLSKLARIRVLAGGAGSI